MFLRWLGALLALSAAAVMWGVSASANFAHALQLSDGSDWSVIFGALSVAADALKAMMPLAIVAAIGKRSTSGIIAAVFVLVMTTAWSCRSALGFIVTTIEDTSAVRERNRVLGDSLAQQLADQVAVAPWLTKQSASTLRPRNSKERQAATSARVDFLEAAKRNETQIDKLRQALATTKPISDPDPVGTFLKDTLGIERVHTHMATSWLLLLLMEVCSIFGLTAVRTLIPHKPTPVAPKVKAPKPTPASVEMWAASWTPTAPAADPELPPAKVTTKKPKKVKPDDHSEAFADHLLNTLGEGVMVKTAEMQSLYRLWCVSQNVEPVDQFRLGQMLSKAGIKRIDRKNPDGTRSYQIPKAA